jgi:hypothetical protein
VKDGTTKPRRRKEGRKGMEVGREERREGRKERKERKVGHEVSNKK